MVEQDVRNGGRRLTSQGRRDKVIFKSYKSSIIDFFLLRHTDKLGKLITRPCDHSKRTTLLETDEGFILDEMYISAWPVRRDSQFSRTKWKLQELSTNGPARSQLKTALAVMLE